MACALAVATTVVTLLAQNRGIQPDRDHPILAIGSPAPDFALPGVDGKIHKLSDYAAAKILAIVFESNHCPTSQLYEGRIEKLYEDYRSKGVTFVAINPNNPGAIRLDELGYTDVTDSLAEMNTRRTRTSSLAPITQAACRPPGGGNGRWDRRSRWSSLRTGRRSTKRKASWT
jgi:hypothetical protein